MDQDTNESNAPKKMRWIGYGLTTLPALMLLMSATMKLTGATAVVETFELLGYPMSVIFVIGLVELACTALYVVPRTSVLGAILLTGYLGGAVASHVRVEEPFFVPIVIGIVLWGGLFLRDERIRSLIPLVKQPAKNG